jgi:hypothetical protein
VLSLEYDEPATAEWVDSWNNRRLHGAIADVPPREFEAVCHAQPTAANAASFRAAEPLQDSGRFSHGLPALPEPFWPAALRISAACRWCGPRPFTNASSIRRSHLPAGPGAGPPADACGCANGVS